MSEIPAGTLGFVLTALEATPAVVWRLALAQPESWSWETRTDPARFSAREVVAHLADWENVFQDRLKTTLGGGNPELCNPDPEELAAAHRYDRIDPRHAISQFQSARSATLRVLGKISGFDWDRPALHPVRGTMTLAAQVVHMLAHDGYHVQQLLSLFDHSVSE